jgi:hypothetical protein
MDVLPTVTVAGTPNSLSLMLGWDGVAVSLFTTGAGMA